MRQIIFAVIVGCLTACTSIPEANSLFTLADFAHLKFLEGRWEGTGPDGKLFYEQYSFPHEAEMKSTRFAAATFAEPKDGSVVTLDAGRVISRWGEFTWQASELAPGRACFVPLNAPGSFCWEGLSATSVQVTQQWTDEHGKPQQYVVPLRRL